MGNLLTAVEVARHLRCSQKFVYTLVKRGELKAVTVGNRYRFEPSEVEAYKTRNGAAA